MKDIIIKKGKKPGKTSVILAGIHGNEKCGVNAFNKILPTLEIDTGTVYFIYANPKAIEKNVRYVDKNLNRLFKNDADLSKTEKESYEFGRMNIIKGYLDKADALLDIHASNNSKSKPFIICEEISSSISSKLSIETITTGFDELEPGGTDGYMNKVNKIGICIECGYSKDPVSSEIAEKSIFEFLTIQGHIKNKIIKKQKEIFHMNFLYHSKTSNFRLSKKFEDFENITKGQIIGVDGDEEILSHVNGIILFARDTNLARSEAFLCGIKKTN